MLPYQIKNSKVHDLEIAALIISRSTKDYQSQNKSKNQKITAKFKKLNQNQYTMRFTFCLLLILVVCATFTRADQFSALTGKRVPVKLYGSNAYPVKCSLLKNDCGCWQCFKGFLLQCNYKC